MNEIIALTVKDLRLLVRDKVGFFFVFFFPLIYSIFFGLMFSGGGGGSNAIELAVVDEDGTVESREFATSLSSVAELDVVEATREDAQNRVRTGKLDAMVVIPAGFSDHADGMFRGDPPRVEVGLDPSRRAEAAMLRGMLMRCAFEQLQDLFSNREKMASRIDGWLADVRSSEDMDPVQRGSLEFFLPALSTFVQMLPASDSGSKDGDALEEGGSDNPTEDSSRVGAGLQPIVIEKVEIDRERRGPSNSFAISFPQGIIWGVMGCAAAFGISLVSERTSGTLARLRMAPMGRWKILAGKAGACFVTTVCVMIALLLIAAVIFKVRPASAPLLVLAVICTAFAFVGIMMLLSVLGKTEQAAGGIGWAVLMIMAMIGGGMVPRMFMPGWMQSVSHLSPVKWAIYSMEGAIWRGLTPAELAPSCIILLVVGIASFGVGLVAFRWTE